jgi:nicotinate phosphoribosyltransferase
MHSGMNPAESMLLTDLYQLTMVHGYYELGMQDTAVFELFVRELPPTRRFLIAAGLEQVIEYLEALQFTPADLEFLASLNTFPPVSLCASCQAVFEQSDSTIHFLPQPVLPFGL